MTYKRTSRIYCVLLAALLAALFFPEPARAADGGRTSSLTLQCHYTMDDGTVHYMAGDVYLLYQVAAANLDASGGIPVIQYTAIPPFPVNVAAFQSLTTTERRAKAKSLENFVSRNGVSPYNSIRIGADGSGTATGLSPGLYLCVRDAASPSCEDYLMDPFLFESIQVDKEQGFVGYDLIGIIGTTKYEPKKPTPPIPEPPDDDDYNRRPRPPYYTARPDGNVPGSPTVRIPGANAPLTQFTEPTAPLTQFPPGMAPTSGMPPVLPQTGQLKWPVPLLIVMGVMSFLTGFELRYGGKKPHDTK